MHNHTSAAQELLITICCIGCFGEVKNFCSSLSSDGGISNAVISRLICGPELSRMVHDEEMVKCKICLARIAKGVSLVLLFDSFDIIKAQTEIFRSPKSFEENHS